MNREIRVSLVFLLAIAILLPLPVYADDYQNFSSYMDNNVKSRYNPNLKAVDSRQNPLRRLMNSSSGYSNNNSQLGMGGTGSGYGNNYSSDVQGRSISLSNVPPSKSAMAYNQYRTLPAQKYVRPVAVASRSNPLAAAVNTASAAPAAQQTPVVSAPPVVTHNSTKANTSVASSARTEDTAAVTRSNTTHTETTRTVTISSPPPAITPPPPPVNRPSIAPSALSD